MENNLSLSLNNICTVLVPSSMLVKDNEISRKVKQRNEMKIYEREEVHYVKIKEKI